MLLSDGKRSLWAFVLVLLVLPLSGFAVGQNPQPDPTKLNPSISLTKTSGAVNQPADGTCRVDFDLKVKNRGDENLVDVQIYDDLAEHIAPAEIVEVGRVEGQGLIVNTHFNGVDQITLLQPGQTLVPGDLARVSFRLTLRAAAGQDRYVNKAKALARGERSNQQVIDQAQAKIHCPAAPPVDPAAIYIGAAKSFRDLELIGIGEYAVTVRVAVENLSTETVENVQLNDDLMVAFAGVNGFAVISPPRVVEGEALTPNDGFDGLADINLLTGTDLLPPESRSVLEFRLSVSTGDNLGPYSNQIVAEAVTETGEPLADLSDDGEDPDPNGNGIADEVGENDPTPIEFPPFAVGAAKALSAVRALGGDRFAADFVIVVENLSSLPAPNVQVSDDLLAQLAPVETVAVSDLAISGDLTELAADYDGIAQTNLLSGSESLPAGGRAELRFTAEFTANDRSVRLNQASVSSTSDEGRPLSEDQSDNGTDPDLNGNGNPGDPGEDDPTPVELPDSPAAPVVGLANELSNLAEVAPGEYQAEFTIRVENLGDVAAPGVQIIDDLAPTFAGLAEFEVGDVSITGDLTALNPAFDGAGENQLLAGTEALPIGGGAIITLQVSFRPGANTGPFSNQPVVSSSQAGEILTSDPADDGAVVDSDGDGNPNEEGENDPTVFALPPVQIGVAKALTTAELQPDGATDLTFGFVIENLSSTRAAHFVQLTDDLAGTFPGASLDVISAPEVTGGLSLANGSFDGSGDTQLLAGSETLAAGATAMLQFTVRVAGVTGEFLNQAEVTAANSDGGSPLASDLSDDGTEPDANGNGDPGDADEDDPTPVTLAAPNAVSIGVAKALTSVTTVAADVFDVAFSFTLTNLSDSQPANFIQLTDNLAETFPGAELAITEAPAISGELSTPNPGFDGSTDTELLSGSESLAPSASAQVTFTVRVSGVTGAFTNQALLTAADTEGGEPVARDLSDDGTEPDSNGNGRADDPDEDDPTPITLANPPTGEAILGLAKALGIVTANDDGTFTLPFTLRVENLGGSALSALQIVDDLSATFPPPSVFAISAAPTSDSLTINPAYDGGDDVQLLSGSDVLAAGATATVDFAVLLTPNGVTQFANTSLASGQDPDGDPVEDTSTDGTEVDPDGDGDPTNNSVPTPVEVPDENGGDAGVIGIAKTTLSSEIVGDDAIEATFRLLVANLGTGELTDVQITEDLAQAFPSPAEVSLTMPPAIEGALSALNSAYDGVTETTLLNGTESLAPGATATVTLTVRVVLNGSSGPFSNQVVANGMNPGGDPSEDLSDDGLDPDPNDDGDPTGPGEDDPTVVEFPAALVGTVFEDLNVDNQLDASDLRLAGWTVELLDGSGAVVATMVTGTDGGYAFMDQAVGDYTIRFRHPQTSTVWGERPATLVAASITRVDFPVVPGGRIYDSLTREPVAGVEITLTDGLGQPLDAACLLPGQQNQVVGDDAAYRFDLMPGAHPSCPTATTNYRLAIVATSDAYRAQPSSILPVNAEPLVAAACAIDNNPEPPCVVQAQTTPPSGSQDTTYYLQWTVAAGDDAVVNNHIPLDPGGEAGPLAMVTVVKRAQQDTAVQGDLVGYEVLVTNLSGIDTPPMELLDNVPAGFQFVSGSQTLRLPGADNVLDTADDLVTPLAASGVDPTMIGPFIVPGDTAVAVRYLVRVSTGVTHGEYINTVTPLVGGTPVGEPASTSVEVVADPIFEKTTIIGKVFNDANGDGRQDPEEAGLPGVRLATVGGLLIETDQHGRYHIADVDVPRAERGANFILKLDTASLPRGAEVISENPRVIRITQALMSKINFAVQMPGQALVVEEKPRYKRVRTTTQFADEYIEPVRFASGKSDIPDSYLATLSELLDRYQGKQNLRVRFIGHTDSQPLSARAAQKYVDNQGLSEARARQVAEFVTRKLGLDAQMVETVGRADREAVASNATLDGMRLNRRVEIELLFDEAVTEETVVTGEIDSSTTGSSTSTTEVRYASGVERIEPVRFASGEYVMSAGTQRELDRRLANFADVEVTALQVTGHADANPYVLSGSDDGNAALSQQRAQTVADYIAGQLKIPTAQVSVAGKGAAEPIADNNTRAGRDLNRRVEVELTVRRKSASIETQYLAMTPVRSERWVDVEGGGRLWMSEDALLLKPRMDVLALTDVVVDQHGHMIEAVPFAAHSNYGALLERYQLDIYDARDTDFIEPLASLQASTLAYPEAFEWLDDERSFRPGQRLAYVLRAQADDAEDVTHARIVEVVSEAKPNLLRVDPATIWSQNNLDQQRISLRGSRIRVHGADFQPRSTVKVAGNKVPVADDGQFVYEFYAPPGAHSLAVSGNSTRPGENGSDGLWHTTLTPEVDDDYAFIVGLANLTIGDHSLSGDFEPLTVDDHFDESVYVDGRLAFYAKAKIKGKYLITAQLDSTEDELSNFTDNLKREDPRRIFRQLDPDRYYAVYGDDSTTVSDVDTQGAFYLRVDWDRNQALWGNYNTGMTDTEYMQYNRSLYGAKLSHKSEATTRFGDAARSLTVFGSEAQSAAAHVTFRATGGSLYYLKHTDVVQGSEKVWVEVRQRDTQQVVERQDFIEGRDYEVDALQGRIILRQPLSQVVNDRAPAIIRSSPLEGDDVYLLVDYEYVPDNFAAEDATYGGRAKVWLGDHVGIGVSKVIDERGNSDFDLQGVDVTLKASNGTYLNAEIAQSEARQNNANFASADGGLSFNSQNSLLPDALTDGDALAVEGRVNLADLTDDVNGDVRAWYKERDAGFSAGRLRQGTEVTEQGIDLIVQPSDNVRITAGYAELEEEDVSRSEVARLQADVKLGKVTVGGEVRYEDLTRTVATPGSPGTTQQQGDGLLAGVRVGYDLNEAQTVYAAAQTGLSEDGEYRDNDLYAIGLNTQLNEHAAVSIEAADGDRGHALTGGLEYSPAEHLTLNMKGGVGPGAISQFSGNYQLAEGHELYGSYAVDPDRTFGERNLLTVGQRRDFGNRFGIFTESQFGKDDRYAGASHAFGVDYTTDQDWVLTALMQSAEDDQGLSEIERNALSLGAAVKRDDYKFSAKIEYREDENASQESEQYLLSSSYTRIASPARRWLGQLNVSWTDDELNGGKTARFVEFDIGHAYRPVANDRWNLLTKYGYFYDLVSAGQSASRPDQRVHILSAEALYELSTRWELGGKLALKEGQVRLFRDSGSWEDYGLGLAVVRARYHVTKAWDALGEYRYLRDRHGDNARHGALLGVYRHLGDHFKVGVGYNFTDFSDDIRDAEYDNHGWFVDLVGKF